jgi:hypothetical protein
MKGSEPIADRSCPILERGGDEGSGLGVALSELTAERTEGAASLSLPTGPKSAHHLKSKS